MRAERRQIVRFYDSFPDYFADWRSANVRKGPLIKTYVWYTLFKGALAWALHGSADNWPNICQLEDTSISPVQWRDRRDYWQYCSLATFFLLKAIVALAQQLNILRNRPGRTPLYSSETACLRMALIKATASSKRISLKVYAVSEPRNSTAFILGYADLSV